MREFKSFGIGLAVGLMLSLHILSTAPSFNWLGRHFICAEIVDDTN